MAIAVYFNRPPSAGFLLVWGQHATGWWGCVAMRVRVAAMSEQAELDVAAWMPSHAIHKQAWAATEALARVALPVDQRQWPGPPRWPSWYAGIWTDGLLTLPPGAEMISGPAWRKR